MASQEPALTSQKSKKSSEEPETTPQEPVPTTPLIPSAKYSNRVVLKTILERSDGGVGLAGARLVIGGWVKSSNELRNDPPSMQPEDNDGVAESPGHKEFSCMEILQTRVPLFRSIAKIFGASGNFPVRARLQQASSKPPAASTPSPPPIVKLLVNDGSCVASLHVCKILHLKIYVFLGNSVLLLYEG